MLSGAKCLGYVCLLAVSICGCGVASPSLTTVSGTVTFEGEPVGPGTVAFVPLDQSGALASGNIDEDGKFTMSTSNPGDGVKPGEYQVAITVEKEPAHGDEHGNIVPTTFLTPERYMNPATSGITATVEAGKALVVTYDIKP